MSYSLDLRELVIKFVNNGGSVLEASKRFEVGKSTIYRWLKRGDLKPTKVAHRFRKIDRQALALYVEQYPNCRLSDYANHFGVRSSAISYAFKQMKITRKKNSFAIKKRKRPRQKN